MPKINCPRHIIFGGEALNSHIVMEWQKKYEKNGTVFVNMYGTTETIIHATFRQIEADESVYAIGQRLQDLRVYLLDAHGDAVLLGAEGEIFIGGAGVARGYLNQPELTVERFLFDPFSDEPIENSPRMYRTGDMARYRSDNSLIFLGRVDQQLKIRGIRIELGEIEARLVEHPDVHEVSVQAKGSGLDTYLVAYVIADAAKTLPLRLRSFLSKLLPDYMIPAAYLCLSSLPLTTSGKIDRQALPEPNDDAFAHQLYEAPHDEMEKRLADIWRELLNIDRISRHDNFFELGGHSLLVMRFINKAKLQHMHIDARGVFSFPILKNLAEQLSNRSKRFYCDAAIPVRQYGNEAPLFLLPDGLGDISYAFELARDIDKEIPVYALPWTSPDTKQPTTIEEMAGAMMNRIKSVQPNGPCAIAGYSSGGILAIEIAKQLHCNGYSISFLGLIDTYSPIAAMVSDIQMLLTSLQHKFPDVKTFTDPVWMTRINELTFSEAIEEIYKTKTNLNRMDIEWEILLTKQRYNYQKLCAAYEIDSISIKIQLFKAVNFETNNIPTEYIDYLKKLFNQSKLGWENYSLSHYLDVIEVEGDHLTMITDPEKRSILGKQLTKFL